MFVGEAPGRQRGQAGPAVRRPGGPAARPAARRDRPRRAPTSSSRTPQVPAARQPRPAAAGDRRLPGLPVPPARADPAARRLHARQLLDEAAARRPATGITRLHGRDEIRRSGRGRCGCTRSTTRPRRSTRRAMLDVAARGLRADPGAARARPAAEQPEPPRGRRVPEPELVEEIRGRRRPPPRRSPTTARSSGCSNPRRGQRKADGEEQRAGEDDQRRPRRGRRCRAVRRSAAR